jgi:hypothetical protein
VRDHDVFLRVWNHIFTGIDIFAQTPPPQPPLPPPSSSSSSTTTEGTAPAVGGEGGGVVAGQLYITSNQRIALLRKLKHDVFAKNEEELITHIDWYMKYLELTNRKKILLADWRKIVVKRQRKENSEKAVQGITETPNHDIAAGDDPKELLEAEELLQQFMSPGQEEKAKEMQQKTKQRLAKWKQEKQRQEEEEKVSFNF